jgi:3,4-dihydroxy 2-butanone 4-phosphate synthase/GTP cyclohydrolase II
MPSPLDRVRLALEDIRAGRMVIVVDDEDRENEGDLVMAASKVTPEAINFMAREGRGLICLALTDERVRRLGLPMMVEDNRSPRTTAFTVSIEAARGVTTGISAQDRALTVQAAVAPEAKPEDIVSPGHVFPLRARPGGVLQRTGHTEASVDLAELAGLEPAGVICEIMNDDGSMARLPDLQRFAETHGLRLLSVADLVQYRLDHERLVQVVREGEVILPSGSTWTARVYEAGPGPKQFLALTLGLPEDPSREPVLVRMHAGSVVGDVFGARATGRAVMGEVLTRIEEAGRGVVVFIPPTAIDLDSDLAAHLGTRVERPKLEHGEVLREYGFGAQVLRDLGLRQIRLLTNKARRIAGLDGYGLEVVEQVLVNEAAAATEGGEPLSH